MKKSLMEKAHKYYYVWRRLEAHKKLKADKQGATFLKGERVARAIARLHEQAYKRIDGLQGEGYVTAEPVPYYAKVPPAKNDELAIVIDPMLATGGSACDAFAQLKKLGYRRIVFLNLIAAPEGIAKVETEHPDVPVFTAAKDERLNSHFYIVPGLGDAGDRIFGTL